MRLITRVYGITNPNTMLLWLLAGAHNAWEREGGGGKECEALTHLTKNSKLTHATRVTKNTLTTCGMVIYCLPAMASCLRPYTCRRSQERPKLNLCTTYRRADTTKIAPSARAGIPREDRGRQVFASGRGDLRGVCPSIGGTNVPLARRGILDFFDTYTIDRKQLL